MFSCWRSRTTFLKSLSAFVTLLGKYSSWSRCLTASVSLLTDRNGSLGRRMIMRLKSLLILFITAISILRSRLPSSGASWKSFRMPSNERTLAWCQKCWFTLGAGNFLVMRTRLYRDLTTMSSTRVREWLPSLKTVGIVPFWPSDLWLVIDIIEPEEHFAVDQYDDLASTQKPTLTIKQSEVKYVHSFVSKELETMVYSPPWLFLTKGPARPWCPPWYHHPTRIVAHDGWRRRVQLESRNHPDPRTAI